MTNPVLKVSSLTTPWQTMDPFLFCMHHDDTYPAGDENMGPVTPLNGRTIGQDFSGKDGWSMYHGSAVPGFPKHPHRGFETVTVVRSGIIDHADSVGASSRFGEGDLQWMTAGRGIVHSEMFPLRHRDIENPTELFQIWLNLPASRKMVAPHFKMIWGNTIPREITRDGNGNKTTVSGYAGTLPDGTEPPAPPPDSWAADASNCVAVWTIKMTPNATWTLPAGTPGTSRQLYFFDGDQINIGSSEVGVQHAVSLDPVIAATLQNGPRSAEFLFLQGRPINEPIAQYGPFVMNTNAEIQQALADYRGDQFGGWQWPGDGPTHPRDAKRFARYADGVLETQDA